MEARGTLGSASAECEIAGLLNTQGVATDFGRALTRGAVHQILTNEKYTGNNVYHRTSFKLKRKKVEIPPDRSIRDNGESGRRLGYRPWPTAQAPRHRRIKIGRAHV